MECVLKKLYLQNKLLILDKSSFFEPKKSTSRPIDWSRLAIDQKESRYQKIFFLIFFSIEFDCDHFKPIPDEKLVMLKSKPNRPGPASADLGLAGRASVRPAGPETETFFKLFYFLKDYLSLCLPISMHKTY
jgi:hypothetical protein